MMDDVGKRLLLAIALSFLVLLTFGYFFPPVPRPLPQQKTNEPTLAKRSPKDASGPGTQTIEKFPEKGLLVAKPDQIEEETITLETDKFIVTFSNLGGYIKQIQLKEKQDSLPVLLSQAKEPGLGIGVIEFEGLAPDHVTAPYEVKKVGKTVLCRGYIDTGLTVTKEFDFHKPDYVFDLKVKVENTSNLARQVKYRLMGALSLSYKQYKKRDQGYLQINALVDNQKIKDTARHLDKGPRRYAGQIRWTGVKGKYFCQILRPDKYDLISLAFSSQTTDGCLATGVETSGFLLAPSSSVVHGYELYVGPLDMAALKEFGAEQIIDYGFLGGISQLLLLVLKLFYNLVHNWGIAIILLSVLIKIILHPLTAKSMRSMKEMQALQPHIARIREEYRDNPQKMNKEMMELYRKHRVNPLGGCFPMLLQMPIFIALYQTLNRAVELRGAGFLWIRDLSGPDAIYTLPFSLPVIGDSINLLPVVMGVAMYLQQILTPAAGAQASQQRMMAVMMPVMFTLILYNFPSGLVLYWLVNTILSAVHQYFVMRQSG